MDASATQLTDIKFNEAKRGYDPVEVDNFLEKLGDAVVKLQEKVREANRRADDAERRAADAHRMSSDAQKRALAAEARVAAGGGSGDEDELAETLKKTLLLAQRTADETVKEATAEAERLVTEAKATAAREIEDATRSAAEKLARVEDEIRGKRDVETADLRAKVEELEAVRVKLVADVEALESHVGALRDRMRAEAEALVKLVDDRAQVPPPSRPALQAPPVDLRDPKPTPERPARPAEPVVPTPRQTGPVKAVPAGVGAARGTRTDQRPVPHVPDTARSSTGPPKPVRAAPPSASTPQARPVDADPATQPVSVIEKNPKWDPDDGFLDELRKAAHEESPLGPPDAAADAAMHAFFSAKDDDLPKRSRFRRR